MLKLINTGADLAWSAFRALIDAVFGSSEEVVEILIEVVPSADDGESFEKQAGGKTFGDLFNLVARKIDSTLQLQPGGWGSTLSRLSTFGKAVEWLLKTGKDMMVHLYAWWRGVEIPTVQIESDLEDYQRSADAMTTQRAAHGSYEAWFRADP
jgi:hypothetical protein